MSNTDTMSNTENSLEHQWHYLPTREVAQHLNSNLEIGLTSNEVSRQNRLVLIN